MQGVDKIIETILEDAERDALSVREESERRAESMRQVIRAEVAREQELVRKKAEQDSLERERHAATTADLERRRMQLAMRQEMVEQVFRQSLDAMITLPYEKMQAFLMRTLLEAVSSGREEVLVSGAEQCINDVFVAAANQKLKMEGKAGELRLSAERVDIAGGFLLREQGILTNCSFEMILRIQRPLLEKTVVDMIFTSK